MARPSETELIARYFAPLAGSGGLGLQDDAALVPMLAGRDLVLTKDALIAGVHFFPFDPPADIARKGLRVNLSDLAAKGSTPLGFALALALPDDWTESWLEEFARGLGEDARAFKIDLLGGDTVRTPGPLMISITALGHVPHGKMVRRSGAQVGDRLYVTGTIGDSALGLKVRLNVDANAHWVARLSARTKAHLLERYLLPRPRIGLAKALGDYGHAGMDISDGFVGDLAKMLAVSGVGADVKIADIPLSFAASEAIAHAPSLLHAALTGGDDYELLCAVPPEHANAFETAARLADIAVRDIGMITSKQGLRIVNNDHNVLDFGAGAFSHF